MTEYMKVERRQGPEVAGMTRAGLVIVVGLGLEVEAHQANKSQKEKGMGWEEGEVCR